MKLKLLSLLMLSLVFTAGMSQNTVIISFDGSIKANYSITTGETNLLVPLKKSDCKKLKKMLVQIKSDLIGAGPYKRSLDITDKADQTVVNLPETANGAFTLTDAATKALLAKGSLLKLYLLMQPADERLLIPTKHIYMGTLSAK